MVLKKVRANKLLDSWCDVVAVYLGFALFFIQCVGSICEVSTLCRHGSSDERGVSFACEILVIR